jgi:hemerythrin-like domain-containing protein
VQKETDMARSKGKKRGSSRQPEAIAMLIEDHQKVQKLFKQFEKAESQQEKSDISERACNELTVHAELEEQVFYPAVREAISETDLLDEAEVEHGVAKELIERLKGMDSADEEYAATFTVLGEYVNHHIEEEQNEMFPKVKKADLDLEALAAEMMEKKQELMAQHGMSPEEGMTARGRPQPSRSQGHRRSAGR